MKVHMIEFKGFSWGGGAYFRVNGCYFKPRVRDIINTSDLVFFCPFINIFFCLLFFKGNCGSQNLWKS